MVADDQTRWTVDADVLCRGCKCTIALPRAGKYRVAQLGGCRVEKADVGSRFASIVLNLVDLVESLPSTNERVPPLTGTTTTTDCCLSTARASVQS